MCRLVETVLVDQETVYALRHGKDRLFPGVEEQPQRIRARSPTPALVVRPLREGAPRRACRQRFVKTGAWPSRAQHFVRAKDQHRCRHAHGVARVARGLRGPCLDRLKGGHSSGGLHRHVRVIGTGSIVTGDIPPRGVARGSGASSLLPSGTRQGHAPAVVARWGGQRRPEWLSRRGSAARSARGALVKRLRIRTVIGVQFWLISQAE
jgi:hypothetical protein